MKVSVFGAGYVGLVTAACLAEMGNSVICVDINEDRVNALNRGEVPIHEPGLTELVTRNQQASRLSFTMDASAAVSHATIIFIAVGTPANEDGSADVEHVLAAARTIGQYMQDYKVVVNKSTVPVGTADRVRSVIAAGLFKRSTVLPFAVVSNPEFLKEGAAISDFMSPDRVIIGSNDDQATLLMRALYAPFLRNRDRILIMDLASAELSKYVANAMLATRISFMNEMALLAQRVGADIEQVRLGIGSDPRIGTHFLYAGCGWGGSCFPKDVKALARMGEDAGHPLTILESVRSVNDTQRLLLVDRVVQRFGDDLRGVTFGVWGLAFKPGTDDLREAPSLVIIDELLRLGATVRAFDPVAMPKLKNLWGERAGFEMTQTPMQAADGASALLLVTEWREFRSPDFAQLRTAMREPIVIDGRNLFDPVVMEEAGFEYVGIGRGKLSQFNARQTGRASRELAVA
jgi:UDPglucose 6-dehydrogenase